jgi:creatinine amidohydrolase
MAVFDLAHLTWEEVRDLDRTKAVAILPVGAVEAHGPHLPLATDVIIAETMARAAAVRLSTRGCDAVLLPVLAYTAADFAAGFSGTVSVGPDTLTSLLADIARSLGRHGFTVLAIANAHFDPGHVAAIEAAMAECRRDNSARIVFPDLTKKPWALRLTEEFRSGACHAGQYESSIVMAARPELVREPIRRSLPANPRSLSAAIRAGKTSFEAAGGPRAYFGSPGDAAADEGLRTIEVLGAILEEAVLAERGR